MYGCSDIAEEKVPAFAGAGTAEHGVMRKQKVFIKGGINEKNLG